MLTFEQPATAPRRGRRLATPGESSYQVVMVTKSRAVVMRRTGPPEVLAVEEVTLSPLARGQVRLRALASAVNHSDLEIRAGNWPIRREQRFPYVPGLEVVGEVVEVAPDVRGLAVGDRAWTVMQGLGGVRAERDGGYAEHVTAELDKRGRPVALTARGRAVVAATAAAWARLDLRLRDAVGNPHAHATGETLRALLRLLDVELAVDEWRVPIPEDRS